MALDNIERFSARQNTQPPARLGQRYDHNRFLPEPGNTVVCHLDHEAPAHVAVLEARERLLALPGADRFLYTPKSSLHMTLFEGVIDTRRQADAWPQDLDHSTSVAEVTTVLRARLQDFSPPPAFSVRATGVVPTGLTLAGATDEDEATMRAWRDALTQPFGYRHEDHNSYGFHMTFAYPTGWLPEDVVPTWRHASTEILNDLTADAPVLPLKPPAFCSFSDMTAFPELLVLQPGG